MTTEDLINRNFTLEWAEQGDANAQYDLGKAYYHGINNTFSYHPQDHAEAVRWYRKAAEQGHADAQADLGHAYYLGKGVPKHDREAIHWYRKATEQGHADAQHFLGEASKYGIGGVEQDYTEAAYWYAKAAEQGHIDAQIELGLAYRDGKGVPQSNIEAYAWLNLAKMGDDAKAASLHHDWLSIAKAGEYVEEEELLPLTNSMLHSEIEDLTNRMLPSEIKAAQERAMELFDEQKDVDIEQAPQEQAGKLTKTQKTLLIALAALVAILMGLTITSA